MKIDCRAQALSFTSLWFIAAFINMALLFGTYKKLRTDRTLAEHSYLNDDRPIEMPVAEIPTVEMTFHEVSRFGLDDADSEANWETLYANPFDHSFQYLGPYNHRHISEAYYATHCLYVMHNDFDKPNHRDHPSPHFVHCLMTLRQLFLCNADMTLEEGDFTKRNFTTDRIGETRTCRDWSRVADWVDSRYDAWLRKNAIELSEAPRSNALC